MGREEAGRRKLINPQAGLRVNPPMSSRRPFLILIQTGPPPPVPRVINPRRGFRDDDANLKSPPSLPVVFFPLLASTRVYLRGIVFPR